MPVDLLVATGNAGKIREFRRLLGDLPGGTVRTLADVPKMPEPVEDGASFEDNAAIKAIAAARTPELKLPARPLQEYHAIAGYDPSDAPTNLAGYRPED